MWGRRVLAILLAVCATTGYALADVVVRVDLSNQRMHVIVNGSHYAARPLSTRRKGYPTPTGSHRPRNSSRERTIRASIAAGPDAVLDLFPWRIRHSWHLRSAGLRAARFAWLHQATSQSHCGVILAGQHAWKIENPDRYPVTEAR